MFETLYRTDARGKSFANPSDCEYYQPRIDSEFCDGKYVYFVRETHGFFDDSQKKMINRTETLRASSGFVHAFAWDPMSPSGTTYRVLPKGETEGAGITISRHRFVNENFVGAQRGGTIYRTKGHVKRGNRSAPSPEHCRTAPIDSAFFQATTVSGGTSQ